MGIIFKYFNLFTGMVLSQNWKYMELSFWWHVIWLSLISLWYEMKWNWKTIKSMVPSVNHGKITDFLLDIMLKSIFFIIYQCKYILFSDYQLKSMKCKKADTKTVLLLWNSTFPAKNPRSGSRTTADFHSVML